MQTKQTILVVEDHPINREVIRRQFELLGWAVDLVGDGVQALDQWRRSPGHYALLLIDLSMPFAHQLAVAIRAEAAGRDLPIVALTTNPLPDEVVLCRGVGISDFLQMPIQLPELEAVLRRCLPVAAAPAAEPEKLLDIAMLKSFIGDDDAMANMMLQEFTRVAAGTQADMRQASQNGDWEVLGANAHRLKSSARYVGAVTLGNACERLEALAKKGETAAAVTLAREVDQLTDRVRAAIAALRG